MNRVELVKYLYRLAEQIETNFEREAVLRAVRDIQKELTDSERKQLEEEEG